MEPSTAMETRATERTTEQGDSLAELYVRHAPGATRLAYMLCGDRELAADLAQEAFVRLAGRFRHLREPDSFEAYLRKAVTNLFLSHLRRRRLERAYVARERGRRERHAEPPDVGGRDELWRALQELPARQRSALVLRYYEDLSEQQAADAMACSVPALKSLVARGMETLRGTVEEER
jgi:RNA polymerase sigma-70 factor (sigma-E family)